MIVPDNITKAFQHSLDNVVDFVSSTQVQIEAEDTRWNDPLPIPKGELLPVEFFDVYKLLPNAFQEYVRDSAHRAQVPADLVAIPLIVSFSILLGRAYRIQPKQKDNWEVVPNLWGMIIASSGSLKSNCLKAGIRPLEWLAAREKMSLAAKNEDYQKNKEKYDIEKAALKSAYKKAVEKRIQNEVSDEQGQSQGTSEEENLNNRIEALIPPLEPSERRFLSNDSTVEKLQELLASPSTNGIAMMRDELMALLMGWTKSGREQDRTGVYPYRPSVYFYTRWHPTRKNTILH